MPSYLKIERKIRVLSRICGSEVVVQASAGIAIPLGWIAAPAFEHMFGLVTHPLTRLFLFVVISLSFFHWAHRFRFTLYDGLQLKHLNQLIAVLTYGSAIVGTLIAAFTLWSI